MKLAAIIISVIWFDGVVLGILIGLAIASHIEGRGFWSYTLTYYHCSSC